MAVPRLAVLLIAGVLLVPAAFVLSRVAAGSEESPPPPAPVKASAKPAIPAKPKPLVRSAAPDASKPKPDTARPKPDTARPKPDTAADARKKAAAAGLPASMALAIAKGQTVVLLLTDGKAADDRSTTNAVRSLKGRKNVKIYTDRPKNLGSYRAIVGRVGVSQSPSVVIVKERQARVVEGYVDPETLLQQVLDARR